MMQKRSPWQVTVHVWHALFMREAMARMTADRLGWTWMLLEPLAHVGIMIAVRNLVGRIRFIPGADFVPWLIIGIMTFFIFRDAMNRSMSAIAANRALFAYRQVHPVDTVLVRSMLEAVLKSLVMLILISILSVLGYQVLPYDAAAALLIWSSVWLLGVGFGLVLSVFVALLPETEKFFKMLVFPLYFLSGVIFPVQFMPHHIREFLLLSPVIHGVESMRLATFEAYHSIDGVSILYLHYWAFSLILLGLMLHIRFKIRLMAQ